MRCVLTLLLLFSYSTSFSCYNEYYALDAKGRVHPVEIRTRKFKQAFNKQYLEKQLIELELKLKKKADFKLLSNYGLHLVQSGKVKEALVIFEKLAELHPDEYSIIANLGTTYELSGQNEKALEYIRKGIEINPDSHRGSEWIHVKILEAKIALEKDPNYLNNHSVLNLSSKQKQSKKIFDQLYIQLQERFPFSPKEANPIMADLFVNLGDYYFETISFEHAKAFYQLAQIYYKSDRKDIIKKIEQARKLREDYATKSMSGTPSGGVIIEKIQGVPYQNYVFNPPGSDYSIDWSKVETNPEKLLSYLGIETEKVKSETKTEKVASKEITSKPKKKSDNSMLWIGLTLVLLIISIFTYFKAKKKKH
ncbi:tetratricopeptide repeat protein [Fluviicola taffensis]|uniref:tetratricopeptide repeat protein n=1 Tax=Fluviicola taffensis TaxID=191579 RepID=UPI003137BB54